MYLTLKEIQYSDIRINEENDLNFKGNVFNLSHGFKSDDVAKDELIFLKLVSCR